MPSGLYYFYQFTVEVTDNMSQVDKLVYVPLLFWFVVLFLSLYFLVFCYLLPLFFTAFKTRRLFFIDLLLSNRFALDALATFNFVALFSKVYSSYFSLYLKFCLSLLAGGTPLALIGEEKRKNQNYN